jgi:hypothetical protein
MTKTPLKNAALLVALILFIGSCKDGGERQRPPVQEASPVINPSAPRPALQSIVPKAPKALFLVGGCLTVCERPREALHAFLGKTLNPSTVEAVKPFIDSSILVHNGQRHGDRWASMFEVGKIAERNTDIEKWLSGWLSWTQRIVDPADKEKSDYQYRIIQENQKRFIVAYQHPQLRERDDGRPVRPGWQITFKPRGLEWLVAEIVDIGERGMTP